MSETEKPKSTGISGLDKILGGGLPKNAQILIAGNPGTGKTILSAQFLNAGALNGEKGIYVSFAETKADFYKNMKSLGMDFEDLENKGLFNYLDFVTVGGEGASTAIQRVLKAVTDFGAERLVIDSISAVAQLMSPGEARVLLHSVIGRITKSIGVTTLLVAEIPFGESKISYGMEEFVADGVILLKHSHVGTTKKMELELLKMRGTPLSRSLYEYIIDRKDGGIGLITIPLMYTSEVSDEKITTGIAVLDKMLLGGLYRSSITLVKGASGIGKTVLCLHFITSRTPKPPKGLFICFEEPTGQIVRLGEGMGLPITKLIKEGYLDLVGYVPEALALPEYYKIINDHVENFQPERLVIDSLTAVQRIMPPHDFMEFTRFLHLLAKDKHITTFVTAETGTGTVERESAVSTLADNIIHLKYRRQAGRPFDRELLIIKVRASAHERRSVDFAISDNGITIFA